MEEGHRSRNQRNQKVHGERIESWRTPYLTDGKKRKHPVQEAAEAESRLLARAAPSFYEFQILRFRATNVSPFPFEWLDYAQTAKEYSALLVRLSREYDHRFR